MRFQILGPITVHDESGAVALGGSKPRIVLAVLLLNANEPVSAERLALALWGEDAPSGAVKTVQVHVSRLRKALGDGGAVATTPAGYRLRVRDGELDAACFEGLVEQGRQMLAGGRPEDASRALREALGLWRGAALADLSRESFAAAEIARLEEQRIEALELRLEADLAAGRHAEVVGELGRLVAEHPLRERLAGQQMLALYRCGRQAEALEAYAVARRTLVEEMGIEPGPQLRERHEAILRQDPGLQPGEEDVELPQALDPTSAPPLAGRADELEWLLARWDAAGTGEGRIAMVTGPRGAGKSRLASELAREAHGRGGAVLHATGGDPADAILVALRQAQAATRPTLVVLDDADRVGAGVLTELGQLRSALAMRPVLVVVCAREAPSLPGGDGDRVDTLALTALDADAVHAIAAIYAPQIAVADVPADWLVEASGGVPRRVHEVTSQWARREAANRVGDVAGRAEDGRQRLRSIQRELAGGVEALQVADARIARADTERDATRVVCPYKGLASFDVVDAPYYFGRERLVAELVARLVGAQLLGVVGPSGSGKSSVMRAGLLPALAGGVLPGSDAWGQVLIRPGAHPLRELAVGLDRASGPERTVIAVDQFEETFTTCTDKEERAAFIAELGAAASDRDGRYVVVLALRADFYGRCAAYPELSQPLAANHVLVPSMQRDELRRAIERPADRVGLGVDPELVDALVADVREEPGALPLLQTALLELWQRRDGRRLRFGVYERSGGVRGAVARLAEDAFGQLTDAQQVLARGVLMRLAGEGENGGVERRRVPLSELELDRDAELEAAVALLTDRRLLTATAGSIELAHEALLREWPRLRDWIAENREGLRIHRNVGAAAREWESLHRDDGALYRGARLGEAEEWVQANPDALNQGERAFLEASAAAAQHEQVARRRRLVAAFAGLATVLVAVAVVAIIPVLQGREADRQRAAAASRELAARSTSLLVTDPSLSRAIALAALDRRDTREARSAVRQATLEDRTSAIVRLPDFAYSVVPSRDGRRVVTASEGGAVQVRDIASGKVEAAMKPIPNAALAAELSPDGSRIASAGYFGHVVIANADGSDQRTLVNLGKDNYPASIEFTPDGRRLLVGTSGGEVGFVSADRPSTRLKLLGHHDGDANASLNRSASKAVSASDDRTAVIWDITRGTSVRLEHPSEVRFASFSPDERLVATCMDNGEVRIWAAGGDHRLIRTIEVAQDALATVRFSADSRRIVTSGRDGIVRISSVDGGPALAELKDRTGPQFDAAFVPGSDRVVSVGQGGTLRTWEPLTVRQLVTGPQRNPNLQPSVDPATGDVVSGYDDGAVRIWRPRTGAEVALPSFAGLSEAVFSADGRHVLSASSVAGDPVRLWDVKRRRSQTVEVQRGEKYAIAVDRSGQRVAIATLDKDAIVAAADGSDRHVLPGQEGEIEALEFSADAKHVVSAGDDREVRIHDAADGSVQQRLVGGDTVSDVAFGRDGTRVAAGGADGIVRVWTLSGGPPILLTGHESGVSTVAFDKAGDRVVTAGQDGTVRVWDARGGGDAVTVQRYEGEASGAAFGADETQIVSSGAGEGILRVARCDVCGSFSSALRIARSRPARALTDSERRSLLSGDGG